MTWITILCGWPQYLLCEEHRERFRQLLKRTGILVRTWDYTKPPFADLERGFIYVGWPYLERLWAHTCAYLALLEWYEAAGQPAPRSITPFLEDPAQAPHIRLLRWAILADASEYRLDWPRDATRPPPQPPDTMVGQNATLKILVGPELLQTLEGRATRVFQRATGWIILHELLHLLVHLPPYTHSVTAQEWIGVPHLQEEQADHFACTWSIPKPTDPAADPDRWCVLGMVAAFASICSPVMMPAQRYFPPGPRSHLDAPTRLRRCLNTFVPKQRTLAWRAASLFLELELRLQGLASAESEEFGTYSHLCLVFEKMGGHVERS